MTSGNPAEDIRREPYTAAGELPVPSPDRHAALGEDPARSQAAEGWPEQVRRRADELVEAGAYPNRTQAWQAAYREVSGRQRRALEDQVVAAANRLGPADASPGARLLRDAAASIGEHRANDATRHQWQRPEAAAQAALAPEAGNPARLAATSFATPAATPADAGAAAASSAGPGGVQAVAAAAAAAAAARPAGSRSPRRSR